MSSESTLRTKKRKSDLREWIESALAAIAIALLLKFFVFEFVLVEGSSMNPTLNDGDRLIVTKPQYYFNDPTYKDVIIMHYSDDVEYVKRIVAVGGDTVEIKDSVLYVNKIAVEENYIDGSIVPDYPETTVPDGTYFVLGDNRDNSRDSRYADVGFVKADDIVGKVYFRIYPFEEIGRIE
ncbi:MAG TPA: signal peptidase I [Eubacteriaceae bacterium]|jgi:signal peptidase I|nr:signal peptidase I [Eubacteriaceae bacterium]